MSWVLGYGHIRPECGNLRSKGKAFNAIQSDESDKDYPEETFEDEINYLAFPVSYESSHESGDYKSLDMSRMTFKLLTILCLRNSINCQSWTKRPWKIGRDWTWER